MLRIILTAGFIALFTMSIPIKSLATPGEPKEGPSPGMEDRLQRLQQTVVDLERELTSMLQSFQKGHEAEIKGLQSQVSQLRKTVDTLSNGPVGQLETRVATLEKQLGSLRVAIEQIPRNPSVDPKVDIKFPCLVVSEPDPSLIELLRYGVAGHLIGYNSYFTYHYTEVYADRDEEKSESFQGFGASQQEAIDKMKDRISTFHLRKKFQSCPNPDTLWSYFSGQASEQKQGLICYLMKHPTTGNVSCLRNFAGGQLIGYDCYGNYPYQEVHANKDFTNKYCPKTFVTTSAESGQKRVESDIMTFYLRHQHRFCR